MKDVRTIYCYSENAVHNNRVIIPAAFKRKIAEAANRTVVITVGHSIQLPYIRLILVPPWMLCER
jgi:DNA-binding transcriptional regulator/RsmH inhibitor MraZ